MTICICDISALEIYRSYGRLLPDLLSAPRTSKLNTCTIPKSAALNDELSRLGAKTKPYHLAVNRASIACEKPGTKKRVFSIKLPAKCLIKIRSDIFITSPELTFCMLATLPGLDVIDLALIGFEFCGTYLLDTFGQSWKGFVNTEAPVTNTQKIAQTLGALDGYPGISKAREALALVANHSNSPMETVQAALLGFPRRLGGLGFSPYVLNQKVTTPSGNRYIDFAIPEYKIGFEYKGRNFHTPEQTSRDDRRQNKIIGSGYTIFNVWYEDLAQKNLFDDLVRDASKVMGKRLRIRSSKFEHSQRILRMKTLPSIQHFDSI